MKYRYQFTLLGKNNMDKVIWASSQFLAPIRIDEETQHTM
jgi:hypothetical protein